MEVFSKKPARFDTISKPNESLQFDARRLLFSVKVAKKRSPANSALLTANLPKPTLARADNLTDLNKSRNPFRWCRGVN